MTHSGGAHDERPSLSTSLRCQVFRAGFSPARQSNRFLRPDSKSAGTARETKNHVNSGDADDTFDIPAPSNRFERAITHVASPSCPVLI